MLPLNYLYNNFAIVENLADFYKNKLPEMPRVKAIVENTKLLFKLPQNCLSVQVAEGQRVYKIVMLENNVQKYPFGYFVYIPQQKRFDVFKIEDQLPLLQWKNKKLVYSGCSGLLDRAGVDTLFKKIINVL